MALFAINSMLKLALRRKPCSSVYIRGAKSFPSKSEHNYTVKTDGNVYYPSLSLLKDAKRKHNGTPKTTLPKTWFTRLFA